MLSFPWWWWQFLIQNHATLSQERNASCILLVSYSWFIKSDFENDVLLGTCWYTATFWLKIEILLGCWHVHTCWEDSRNNDSSLLIWALMMIKDLFKSINLRFRKDPSAVHIRMLLSKVKPWWVCIAISSDFQTCVEKLDPGVQVLVVLCIVSLSECLKLLHHCCVIDGIEHEDLDAEYCKLLP